MARFCRVVPEQKRASASRPRREKEEDCDHNSKDSEEHRRCQKACAPRPRREDGNRNNALHGNHTAPDGGSKRCRDERVLFKCEHKRRPVDEFIYRTRTQKAADSTCAERCDEVHRPPQQTLTGAARCAMVDPPGADWRPGQWCTVRLTVRPRPSAFPPMLHGTFLSEIRRSHGSHDLPVRSCSTWRNADVRSRGPGPETAPVSLVTQDIVMI